ncbi:MAG: hypothetical protein SAL70_41370, partial [Scytonema sp. PMC 1070.18]|nr:hypothetical protein [Scytonema sp. PMC 1070.18]
IVYVPTPSAPSPTYSRRITLERIKPPEKEKEIVYVPTPSAPSPTYSRRIELDDSQAEKVVNRTYEVLDLTAAGATVGALAGALAGPVGAAVGGIVGATIGFIGGWLSKRK